MIDSSGARVVLVSSSDENHPPENITDGNSKTFWMSTGMFPQEFVIRFTETTNISAVSMDSYNIKHLKIERNTSPIATKFEPVMQEEFERTEGHLQSNSISLNGCSAFHLRFIITAGHDHFVSVHRGFPE